jgi:diguanylate cyclase (GGDEF)-like protein/PAS domain S-box-containing protein
MVLSLTQVGSDFNGRQYDQKGDQVNVKEAYLRDISDLRGRAANLEAEMASIPVEAHAIEYETWVKIKAYFANNPGMDVRTSVPTSPAIPTIPNVETARKQTADALCESQELFQMIAENVRDLIAVLDTEGGRVYNNPAYRQIFGKQQLEIGSSSFSEIHPEDRDRIQEIFRKIVETGVGERSEFRFLLKDGSIRYIESEGNVVHDAAGKVSKVIVVSRDITERKKIEEQLRYLSYYDVLTGLPNRMLLSDRLKQAIAAAKRDKEHILSLLFIDLDRFKLVNDSHGHAVGDLLLKEIAIRIQDCLRESDTAARIGGDEFVVLLPLMKRQLDTMVVAEKIRQALCQPVELAGHNLNISSSIGIAVYPENGSEGEMLLKNADTAMYYAKQSGRNRIRFFQH